MDIMVREIARTSSWNLVQDKKIYYKSKSNLPCLKEGGREREREKHHASEGNTMEQSAVASLDPWILKRVCI